MRLGLAEGVLKGSFHGSLLIVLAAALWGTTGTSQALTPESSTPETIAALRLVIAGMAMLLMCRVTLSQLIHWPWGKTILAGAAIAVYQFSSFSAMSATGVAVGTIVAMGTAPVFAGILEFLIKKKRPVSIWYISTFLAVTGCFLILSASDGSLQINTYGVILALVAGLFYASYSVLISLFVDTHPPQTVTAIVTCVGALFLLPFLLKTNLGWLGEINGWLVMLYLGLIATAVSYWLFAKGLQTTQISTAVTLTLAEPLVATLLGIVVVGEQVTGSVLAGITLMFTALVLLVLPARRRQQDLREMHDSPA